MPKKSKASELDKRFAEIHAGLRELRKFTRRITFLGDLMADQNQQLNDKIDELQGVVDEAQATAKTAADALKATITDLQAQIAAGPPGLTQEQADALVARISTIEDDLRAPTA